MYQEDKQLNKSLSEKITKTVSQSKLQHPKPVKIFGTQSCIFNQHTPRASENNLNKINKINSYSSKINYNNNKSKEMIKNESGSIIKHTLKAMNTTLTNEVINLSTEISETSPNNLNSNNISFFQNQGKKQKNSLSAEQLQTKKLSAIYNNLSGLQSNNKGDQRIRNNDNCLYFSEKRTAATCSVERYNNTQEIERVRCEYNNNAQVFDQIFMDKQSCKSEEQILEEIMQELEQDC